MKANHILFAMVLSIFVFDPGTVLRAQTVLSLEDCQQLARDNAPRLNDREILEAIGEARTLQAGSSWYPSLELNGKVSYQSDVVTVTLTDPSIPVAFPEVPHDQYGLNLDLSQNIYDGGISKSKKEFEKAQTAADLQKVEVDLYALKGRVNQYFFAVLTLQENMRNLELHKQNLDARYQEVETAVRNGSILDSNLDVIEVELLKVQQSVLEIESRKNAYIETLRVLCGEGISADAEFLVPELSLESPGDTGSRGTYLRPEYLLFDLKDASLEAGKELQGKKRMPVLFAFGQAGYGKPGYNMLSEDLDFYYMVGAGLKWQIWDWNNTSLDKQVLGYQQQILQNQRASFDKELNSMKVQEEAKIEQYRKTMVLDLRVLELQQKISKQAALQLEHGTMTASDYITELNKESMARIKLDTHRVQMMQAIASYLTIEGKL